MGNIKQKDRKEKVDVGVKSAVHYDYDFGLFPAPIKIKVPKEQWIAYVQARFEFEMKHKDLMELLKKKI